MPVVHPHYFSLPLPAPVGAIRFDVAGHQLQQHRCFSSPAAGPIQIDAVKKPLNQTCRHVAVDAILVFAVLRSLPNFFFAGGDDGALLVVKSKTDPEVLLHARLGTSRDQGQLQKGLKHEDGRFHAPALAVEPLESVEGVTDPVGKRSH